MKAKPWSVVSWVLTGIAVLWIGQSISYKLDRPGASYDTQVPEVSPAAIAKPAPAPKPNVFDQFDAPAPAPQPEYVQSAQIEQMNANLRAQRHADEQVAAVAEATADEIERRERQN